MGYLAIHLCSAGKIILWLLLIIFPQNRVPRPIGCLTPGVVTPMRTVPADIVRPEYVGKKTPQ